MEPEQNTRDIAAVEKTVREVMEATHHITRRPSRSEPAIRYAMIDPILWSLGWRTWLHWECGPDLAPGRRGHVDYALFDDHGDIAVYINVQSPYTRRRYGRIRLPECVRGAIYGVAILIYGSSWEIYDLDRRTRLFDNKCVATLTISLYGGHEPDHVATELSQWIARARWRDEEVRVPEVQSR